MKHFIRIVLVPILFAAGAAAARPASAGLLITTRALPPADARVVLSSPAPADAAELGSYPWTHGAGVAVGVGQTFRLERPVTLDRITVLVRPSTDQVAGESIALTLAAFSGPADATPDETLAIAAGLLPQALPAGVAAYLVLDLDDLALEAGRQYGFLLKITGGGNVNNALAEVFHTGGDSYPGGRPFLKEGAFYEGEDDDLVFYLESLEASQCEGVPEGEALTTGELPGFRFWVRFGAPESGTWWGEKEPLCIPEALCVSGALAGRTEVLVRIVGPRPNGYLWPILAKLSATRVEVWIEQTGTGALKCYLLAGADLTSSELAGLFDRWGFLP